MILGVGIDVVEIDRFGQALERRGQRLIGRFFTAAEQEYCSSYSFAAPYYSVRFAAKEAFSKALGYGIAHGIQWVDVEVVRDELGKPGLMLHGRAKELFEAAGGRRVWISLTHSRNVAAATVVLEG